MFKRISAALLAVSVLAAPALAATSTKTNQAPVTKQATKQAPVKTNANTGVKTNTLNANAKMDGHHVSHQRHHRHHKISALKTHKTHTKVSYKQAKPATKRG
jgi:ribosomal protein L7/L12